MIYERTSGVPRFSCHELAAKSSNYCLLIPIINEGERIKRLLLRAQEHDVSSICDIIVCDGDSTDNCADEALLRTLNVNAILIKKDTGKQGAQLRMGLWWAMQRGYTGFITIDGNNKDSIEQVADFIQKLEEGYDFVQGSRYAKGGQAINTPIFRHVAAKYVHAPIISLTAKKRFTDSTNAFRAHSRRYIADPRVSPFREVFQTYELLAYLSVRASQLGLNVCEIPVTRRYPENERTPTKIRFFRGNYLLFKILMTNLRGGYRPK